MGHRLSSILTWIILLVGIDQVLRAYIWQYSAHAILNRGVIFGSLTSTNATIGVLVLGSALVIALRRYFTGTFWQQMAMTLIVAGALSNLIERLHSGGVIDYFSLARLSYFNLADVQIVVGATLLAFFAEVGVTKQKT